MDRIEMMPKNPLAETIVIPAKAGIQLIKYSPLSGTKPSVCPLRGMFYLLDSRFRENDGSNGFFGMMPKVK
jgi:hypothetical protein